jgi:DNA-binding protein H-NS
MANTNLALMSIDALLRLREDVAKVLSRKAVELKDQLRRWAGDRGYKRGDESPLKGRKVAVKYRDRSGNTWAGRGAQPVWRRCPAFLLNIEKRSLPRLMLSGDGLASNGAV